MAVHTILLPENGSRIHGHFLPLERIDLADEDDKRLLLLGGNAGFERDDSGLERLGKVASQVPGEPYLLSVQFNVSDMAFGDLDGVVKIAHHAAFRRGVEIARAEQMTGAGFDIVGLDAPRLVRTR